VKNDGGMLVGTSEGVGMAKVNPNERDRKVKRIILPEGWYLQTSSSHVLICVGCTAKRTVWMALAGYPVTFSRHFAEGSDSDMPSNLP